MTLSFALNSAVSGLSANSAQADVISSNIANALTEGYGRRDVAISSATAGGAGVGVRIDGVVRASSPVATEARRVAEASEGFSSLRATVFDRLSAAVGDPGAVDALATLADSLDEAIAAAADTPESAVLLKTAARAAGDYTTSVNRIALEAISLRSEMDASIASQVDTINSSLTKIQSLNSEIQARETSGGDTSALLDQRERLIKTISSMIPVRTIPREFGTVAIYSQNGGQLLDGKVFELGFEATPAVGQTATIENGGLSGLTTSGLAVAIGETSVGLFDGGSLSAAFAARDREIPNTLASLDALATDLMRRTQDLAADGTQAVGAPGLFTDAGSAFVPGNEVGAAQRLSLNPVVDETKGGDASRLRDGLGATTVGLEGDARILRGLQDALIAPVSGPAGVKGAAGLAVALSADLLAKANDSANEAAADTGRADVLRAAELSDIGVDTDQELTRLLQVEQAFAANARVIEVIDTLMQRLLQI
ncbi:MAG: flagellar hook-associated protein FlgK [Pikeienuella sp.]